MKRQKKRTESRIQRQKPVATTTSKPAAVVAKSERKSLSSQNAPKKKTQQRRKTLVPDADAKAVAKRKKGSTAIPPKPAKAAATKPRAKSASQGKSKSTLRSSSSPSRNGRGGPAKSTIITPQEQLRPQRRKRRSKPKQEIQASTNFVIHFWDPSRMDRCVGYFVREITQGTRKGDIVVQRIGNRKPRTLTLPLKCVIRIDQRAPTPI